MPGSILGNRVRRVEDPDLLTGRSTFVANLALPGCAVAHFVRSPFAHALVRSVDVSLASDSPGVVGVFTCSDMEIDKLQGFMVVNAQCGRPPLAEDRVRFVGEAVALIVAETLAQAQDAAELVVVDYDPIDVVVDPEEALAEFSPLLFDVLGTNLAASVNDPPLDALADATTVVRARIVNQRVAVVPMEADAVAVVPGDDGDGHELTIYVATQMPHSYHATTTRTFGFEPAKVRVVAPHVGGSFGGKVGLAPEHAAVITAARRLGRPVRWVEARSEAMIGAPQGRGQVQWVEMGFDADARITGMRCRMLGDAGAYAGFGGALALGPTRLMSCGVYDVPKIHYSAVSSVTNTAPVGAFRGAGRPEAAAFLERMMDLAAVELGIDPVEIRRRNLLAPFDAPVTTAIGTSYDVGNYQASLDEALRLAGYEELRREQAARREAGDRYALGIGVSVYVEITAGGLSQEYASVEIHQDGTATLRAGTSSHGQGHATAFSMIVSDILGIPLETIRFVQSDTAAVPRGAGTGGSRSLQIGGSAVLEVSGKVLERARELAAAELEAAPEDIVVHRGLGLGVAGVPSRALSWATLATLAERASDAEPPGDEVVSSSLSAQLDFVQGGATYPFGAHVSVVEVDTETGKVRPVRHVAVDDCGRIVNPLLVAGQQHGGVAQGMAQALWEEVLYDGAGNPLTATLADYGMPSAAELPSFEVANTVTPTFRNPLGAKGIGESGTIGATPAVQNAVVDALAHMGVVHIQMPCSPERVWRAIEAARTGGEHARSGGEPLWWDPPAVFSSLPVTGQGGTRPEAADVDI